MRTFGAPAIAFRTFFLILSVIAVALTCTYGQTATIPQFNIVKPSTTGIPGDEVRMMRLDPSGNLWVGARYTFWDESALAMLSAEQLPFEPLAGGGFDTGAWRVWSSVHHPIPSPYLNDLEFAFGNAEDKPVPADYDGDGKADLAVFRLSAGSWYLLRTTAGFIGLAFGANQDVPIPNAFVR